MIRESHHQVIQNISIDTILNTCSILEELSYSNIPVYLSRDLTHIPTVGICERLENKCPNLKVLELTMVEKLSQKGLRRITGCCKNLCVYFSHGHIGDK